MFEMFEKKYFVQSVISNYEDYRQRKFCKLADDLIRQLNLTSDLSILDFGCATGGLLREFKNRGFQHLKGTDPSFWGIIHGKEILDLVEELNFYNLDLLTKQFDLLFLLDILEHVPTELELNMILKLNKAPKVIVRIPVSAKEGEAYVLPVSRNDITHVQCHTKEWWTNLFEKHGYELDMLLHGEAIYDSDGVFAGVFKKCK